MRPAGPEPVHDRAAILAAYFAIAAAALLLAAAPYYAPALPLVWQHLEPVGNGLAGGVVAGSVAIAVYRVGRRSRSREKKFVPARALVAELERALDAVHPSALPGAAGGRYERAGASPHQYADADPHAGRPSIPPPGVPRRTYEGLVASGGMFYLDPTLQVRLHAFYEHAERGDRSTMGSMILPLMLDVAGFRDANAPFTWSGLAWPPRRALFRLRGRRRRRRRGAGERPPTGTDGTTTGAPAG